MDSPSWRSAEQLCRLTCDQPLRPLPASQLKSVLAAYVRTKSLGDAVQQVKYATWDGKCLARNTGIWTCNNVENLKPSCVKQSRVF